MSYTAPYIDNTGFHIPAFADILSYYVTGAQAIFGSSIYLGNDSADYQLLSIIATIANDCNKGAQLAYNSFGAQTVIGAAQDTLYKLNGIKRKVASYSTCSSVVLTGTPNTVITNGKITDQAGNYWDIPSPTTIGNAGTATVVAICEVSGAINAAAGTLTNIATPTYGWTSVTNTFAATVGQPIESDSLFRARQTNSTAIASNSPLNGIKAAIAQLANVNRFVVYENPTGSTGTDPNGYSLPAHSITPVIEGGISTAIANAIWSKKAPGVFTNGGTTVNVTDQYNNITPISYYALAYTPIFVTLGIHQLTGYTTATGIAIQNAIANYLNSLSIGEIVLISALQAVAMSANPSLTQPTFAVRTCIAGTTSGGQSTTDIVIAYNYAAQGIVGNVTINTPVA